MKKNTDTEFAEELRAVKEKLPAKYMTLLDYEFPKKFTRSRVYNVMNAGQVDRDVLKALKKIAKKYELAKV